MSGIFTVDSTLPPELIIGATGLLALAQEIRTVQETRKGSVPLDRDFGVSWDIIDQPINTVLPAHVADVAMQIEKYVPRVEVISVSYAPVSAARSRAEALAGMLRPVSVVRIRKEYSEELL
ncbi:MAG: hypothetical protein LBV80_00660 [Deltaproteobacteria bacterium]|jgi:phage baseplate assembly protein W|nr:hypothetical protein [Deltaproteobacteria bacterium]